MTTAEARTCAGCGGTFFSSDRRKDRCKKNCGRSQAGRKQSNESRNGARDKARAEHVIKFVGVDGEGVKRDDDGHDYVLLSVGDESLSNPDGSRLTWDQILHFLWDHYCRHPDSTYIGFFLGYDFTQWLRTIPEKKAVALLTKEGIATRKRRQTGNPVPFPVWLYEDNGQIWEIDILGNKRFKLRPRVHGAPSSDQNPWLFVCDTGGFWQCSFLSAIDPKVWPAPIATDEEYATIVEGKAKRDVAELDADMIRYNVTENAVLARVMDHLNKGFTNAGIRLDRDQWFGPGQAASAWLDLIGAPLGEAVRAATPDRFRLAAQYAYYGGWFEIMGHGHVPGTTHEYDINSAYPYIISQLPCLLHGKWTEGKTNRQKDLASGHLRLVYATIQGRDPVTGPMPFRLHDGKILRPDKMTGWFWWDELMAARDAGLIMPGRAGIVAGLIVHEWMEYQPCDCPPPIGAIAELYQERLKVGKKTPEGIALKLVYNSAYGKFAQSVGSPKYANAIYASRITSGCRAQILRAIATHPTKTQSLVMVATDGVYFREPHPNLELDGNKLGAWDHETKENLTLMMPGVYWDDKLRAALAKGESVRFKSRGISAKDLAAEIGTLDAQWTSFYEQITAMAPRQEVGIEPWPAIELKVTFAMTTAKQAAVRGAWDTAGAVDYTSARNVSAHPNIKRCVTEGWHLRDDKGFIRSDTWVSNPYNPLVTVSTPYDRTFGEEMAEAKEDLPITDDSPTVYDPFAWIWKGTFEEE